MADIGTTLREARMRAKIDITEVESATKIRAKYLGALENEEWDLLPGPTYVKSFLRTYAEYLGLDVTLLLEEYKRQHERPSDLDQLPITPNMEARRKPARPPRVPRGWIAAAVIVALLVLFAIIGTRSNDTTPTTAQTTTTTSKEQRAARKRAKRRARAARASRRRAAAARRIVRVQLVPTGVVFACLVDARNRPVVNGQNLNPGQPSRAFRSKRFMLTVGNGSVVLKVNGKSIDVPDRAVAVSYTIAAGRAREIPAAQGPTCQ
jgi:cytoskeleton protein RodZ